MESGDDVVETAAAIAALPSAPVADAQYEPVNASTLSKGDVPSSQNSEAVKAGRHEKREEKKKSKKKEDKSVGKLSLGLLGIWFCSFCCMRMHTTLCGTGKGVVLSEFSHYKCFTA